MELISLGLFALGSFIIGSVAGCSETHPENLNPDPVFTPEPETYTLLAREIGSILTNTSYQVSPTTTKLWSPDWKSRGTTCFGKTYESYVKYQSEQGDVSSHPHNVLHSFAYAPFSKTPTWYCIRGDEHGSLGTLQFLADQKIISFPVTELNQYLQEQFPEYSPHVRMTHGFPAVYPEREGWVMLGYQSYNRESIAVDRGDSDNQDFDQKMGILAVNLQSQEKKILLNVDWQASLPSSELGDYSRRRAIVYQAPTLSGGAIVYQMSLGDDHTDGDELGPAPFPKNYMDFSSIENGGGKIQSILYAVIESPEVDPSVFSVSTTQLQSHLLSQPNLNPERQHDIFPKLSMYDPLNHRMILPHNILEKGRQGESEYKAYLTLLDEEGQLHSKSLHPFLTKVEDTFLHENSDFVVLLGYGPNEEGSGTNLRMVYYDLSSDELSLQNLLSIDYPTLPAGAFARFSEDGKSLRVNDELLEWNPSLQEYTWKSIVPDLLVSAVMYYVKNASGHESFVSREERPRGDSYYQVVGGMNNNHAVIDVQNKITYEFSGPSFELPCKAYVYEKDVDEVYKDVESDCERSGTADPYLLGHDQVCLTRGVELFCADLKFE